MPRMEQAAPTPLPEQRSTSSHTLLNSNIWQFLRFGLVGCLNTLIDVLALNCLLWLWPTQNAALFLLLNSFAYTLGALNSFLLNRAWTFQRKGQTTMREVSRFVLTTLAGIACNDLMLGSLNSSFQAAHLNTNLWINVAKLLAIAGTVFISYLAMRLWVFVQQSPPAPKRSYMIEYRSQKGNTSIMVPMEQTVRTIQNEKEPFLPQLWQKLALGGIMFVSLFVNFYHLGQDGFGNLFYAAGVRSMVDSLHNFFFVSYDPGGFVTIDKPPLGFWLQALSAKILGFTPLSIFLPQALAGVLSVLVLFFLVRRHFGVTAGLLAALALALSPLSVVTARNNTIDSTLTLILLLATWAMLQATETGKWRWLLLSAALIGLGFNVKMAEAYLVIPAFGLLYLLAAPCRLWKRLGQLSLAALVLLAISLSWATAVDLIPASQRPYVGSSQNNSEIGLALGYNGLDRVLGHLHFGNAQHDTSDEDETHHLSPLDTTTLAGNEHPPLPKTSASASLARTNQRPIRNASLFGSGTPGPLRLFQQPLGGQISWLLPFALFGLLALAWQRRPRFQTDRQQQALLLWGTWVLTMGSFFSIAGFFHQYYMITFAPAICALFGIGLVLMWQDYRRSGWRGWLLPLALVMTAGEQVYLIQGNPAWGIALIPLIALPCVLVALVLCAVRVFPHLRVNTQVLLPVLGCGIVALLLTPATWSAIPALQNSAISTPSAGPTRAYGFFNAENNKTSNAALVQYLVAHQGNAKFLVATPSSMSADALILATNQPVMAMGGFAGRDPILTPSQLSTLVAHGTVRFFLLNNPTFLARNFSGSTRNGALSWFGLGRNGQNALTSWVTHYCTTVPTSTWQAGATSTAQSDAMLLYDCAGAQ